MPGGRPEPTGPSGLEHPPHPIWDLPAFFPSPLPQGHLPAAWKQGGTWHLGAQVAGARQYWELSHCCGEQRELPTWQAETRTSQRLSGTGLGRGRGHAPRGGHRHPVAPQD